VKSQSPPSPRRKIQRTETFLTPSGGVKSIKDDLQKRYRLNAAEDFRSPWRLGRTSFDFEEKSKRKYLTDAGNTRRSVQLESTGKHWRQDLTTVSSDQGFTQSRSTVTPVSKDLSSHLLGNTLSNRNCASEDRPKFGAEFSSPSKFPNLATIRPTKNRPSGGIQQHSIQNGRKYNVSGDCADLLSVEAEDDGVPKSQNVPVLNAPAVIKPEDQSRVSVAQKEKVPTAIKPEGQSHVIVAQKGKVPTATKPEGLSNTARTLKEKTESQRWKTKPVSKVGHSVKGE